MQIQSNTNNHIQIQSDRNNYKQAQNVTPWDAQVLVKSRKFCYRK